MTVLQITVYPLCHKNNFQRNAINCQFINMNSKDCEEYFYVKTEFDFDS